ncbi:MAG: AMP-binding protein [Loktanella sp.]|nr:AMP-binding protein [Loktanella sp.]
MRFLDALNPRRIDLNISCAAELSQPMSTRQLYSALSAVTPAFPLLNVHLAKADGRHVWSMYNNSQILNRAILPEVRCQSQAGLTAHYAAFSTGVSDLRACPPWKVQLAKVETRTFLLCSFHHAICDGDRSLTIFLDALADQAATQCSAGFRPETAPIGKLNWEAVTHFAETLENPAYIRDLFIPDGSGGPISYDLVLSAKNRSWPVEQAEAALLAAVQAGTANLIRDEQIVVGVPCDGVSPDSREFGYFGNPGLAIVFPESMTKADTAMPPDWALEQSRQAMLIGGISYQDVLSSSQFGTVENPEHLFNVLIVKRKLFCLKNQLIKRVFEPLPSRTPYLLTVNYWFDDEANFVVRVESGLDHMTRESLHDIAARMDQRLSGSARSGAPEIVLPGEYRGSGTGPGNHLHRFLETADRQPDTLAVLSDSGGKCTYGTLATRARTLAAALQSVLGGGSATIAFSGERHPDEIVALLGTSLAGACFLRLDETEPARHAAQIEAADVDALIVPDTAMEDGKESGLPVGFTRASSNKAGFHLCIADNLVRKARPADAYVVMTSGSTGQSRAIRFPARQLERLVEWHSDQLQECQRMLQLSSLMHDVAYHEIFSALSTGRCLAFAGPEQKRSLSELVSFIDRAGLDRIYLPTVLLEGVARTALARGFTCSALRMVIVAGGQLTITEPVREWFAKTGAILANHYGMSETQDITSNFMTGDPLLWPERPHVGRAIAGAEVTVVGARSEPLPAGVVGNLAVRFADMANCQLMVLSDIGYQSVDGHLHVLGRGDGVIKVRGLRLSLDAVESNLRDHDSVEEAAAIPAPQASISQDPWIFITGAAHLSDPDQQAKLVDDLVSRHGAQARSRLIPVAHLPRLKNGKVDYQCLKRRAEELARADSERKGSENPPMAVAADDLIVAAIQKLAPGMEVVEASRFSDLGIDSLGVMALELELAPNFPDLTIADFFNHPTVGALRRHLTGVKHSTERIGLRTRSSGERDTVCVVGLAGRFPGAADVNEFWQSLVANQCLIAAEPSREMDDASRFFVPSFGQLGDINHFDHGFFGLSPAEAYRMDPQMRLFLELCWTALEHSGDAAYEENSRIGLFAGSGLSTYLMNELEPARRGMSNSAFREDNTLQQRLGNDRNYLTSTASYRLGFTGPSITVQAACATSLVAVHYARQALLNDECDIAIAGGVSVIWPEPEGYDYVEGSVRSLNGRCRPFDAGADGTVFSNGGGLVVLKRTADAVGYKNQIYGELLGSAVNHDGGRKINFSAPSPIGQAEVMLAALANAGLTANALDFIEAHGTGTVLGDVIEWSSIGSSLAGRRTDDPCIVGSVKGNIGHLDEGAGIAGFIKACLSVSERCFPGTCHFETLNPSLRSNNRMNVSAGNVRFGRAQAVTGGISAFGMGGINAHAIVRSLG